MQPDGDDEGAASTGDVGAQRDGEHRTRPGGVGEGSQAEVMLSEELARRGAKALALQAEEKVCKAPEWGVGAGV